MRRPYELWQSTCAGRHITPPLLHAFSPENSDRKLLAEMLLITLLSNVAPACMMERSGACAAVPAATSAATASSTEATSPLAQLTRLPLV